ncbi:MAG: PEGA domain-containing protein [Desulfobacterales bacterium]|nr:PEGA domain-containing protein [Desulfobacterales bacterium]
MAKCWNCNNVIPPGSDYCPTCSVMVVGELLEDDPNEGDIKLKEKESASSEKKAEEKIHSSKSQPNAFQGALMAPGTLLFDRFYVKRLVGTGIMGSVYLVHDKEMGKDIALKSFPPKLAKDPGGIQELKREASMAMKLVHKNIVRVFSISLHENKIFLTREFVPGKTLSEFLREEGGSVSIDDALPILKQIANALDYAHRLKPSVIHGDIKPLNVLITRNGKIKLADFGLAKVCRDWASKISTSVENVWPIAYMAPEQLTKGRDIGTWTDVYALANLAYEMLSGNLPFTGDDVRRQIIHDRAWPLIELPEYINEALLAGLAKDKEDRPKTAGAFVSMLEPKLKLPKPKSGIIDKKSKSRAPMIKKFAAITALIALTMMFSLFFKKELFPIFKVLSDPQGALVYIDGNVNGITPLKVDKLPQGFHKVRLILDGYEEYESMVKLVNGKISEVDHKMMPLTYGYLEIKSDPEGAEVHIDGKKTGITPSTLYNIPKGLRKIILKKANYESWAKSVNIIPLKTAKIEAVLEKSFGSIKIDGEPSNSEVFIDGNKKGEIPLILSEIPIGKRKIEFRKQCFDTIKREIFVSGGNEISIKFKLDIACGRLVVNSIPDGASWSLDGNDMGITPGNTDEIPKGKHSLKVTKVGYREWSSTVIVEPGKIKMVQAKLIPIPMPGDIWKDKITGMEFVWVPKGCYYMGSEVDEKGRGTDESPRHKVCVDGFWLGKYEATVGQYMVMLKENDKFVPEWLEKGSRYNIHDGKDTLYRKLGPSLMSEGYPIVGVSWNNAVGFAAWLSEKTGEKFRLPTEAEWEYACKSCGKDELYSGSSFPDKVAWYEPNSKSAPHKVGTKEPNALGLYDMSGNVWEWCQDVYSSAAYSKHKLNNPVYTGSESDKINRGGSWFDINASLRCSDRSYNSPTSGFDGVGLRLVREEPK